ncbi:MAG TPA: GNAT family N-acetyltransferase [Methanoregulaceae archaeon]|nr:GNAT family N-acetyltransferase [Methanoregulaceae archaeon]HPD74882.1 GNAT family N-acetyltransferase [Methanoregulaceae archaeon]
MAPDPKIETKLVKTWETGQIIALYRAGGWWKEEYDPAGVPALITGSFLFSVAVDTATNTAIGMGRVISDGVSDAYIQDLIVLPECRKGGVGRSIVSLLVTSCWEQGIRWIGLVSQPGCDAFYRNLGFVEMKGYIPLLYERGNE